MFDCVGVHVPVSTFLFPPAVGSIVVEIAEHVASFGRGIGVCLESEVGFAVVVLAAEYPSRAVKLHIWSWVFTPSMEQIEIAVVDANHCLAVYVGDDFGDGGVFEQGSGIVVQRLQCPESGWFWAYRVFGVFDEMGVDGNITRRDSQSQF